MAVVDGTTLMEAIQEAARVLAEHGYPKRLVAFITSEQLKAVDESCFSLGVSTDALDEIMFQTQFGSCLIMGDDRMARADRLVMLDMGGDDGMLHPPMASVDLHTMQAVRRLRPRFDPLSEITKLTTKAAAETGAQFSKRMASLRNGPSKPHRVVGIDFGHDEGSFVTGMVEGGILTIDDARKLSGIDKLKELVDRYSLKTASHADLDRLARDGGFGISVSGKGEAAIVPYSTEKTYPLPAGMPAAVASDPTPETMLERVKRMFAGKDTSGSQE